MITCHKGTKTQSIIRFCQMYKYFFIFVVSILYSQEIDLKKIYDPNEHRDIQPKWPMIINNVLPGENPIDSIFSADTVHWVTDGFRVQILASKSMTKADSLSLLLNTALEDSAYVIYETPNYKVRIGDYVVREDADKMRQKLQNMGYRSAWVIRTQITPQRTGLMIRMK